MAKTVISIVVGLLVLLAIWSLLNPTKSLNDLLRRNSWQGTGTSGAGTNSGTSGSGSGSGTGASGSGGSGGAGGNIQILPSITVPTVAPTIPALP